MPRQGRAHDQVATRRAGDRRCKLARVARAEAKLLARLERALVRRATARIAKMKAAFAAEPQARDAPLE